MEVNTANDEAVKFYEGLGFNRVMIIENYYSDGSHALRMRLVLDEAAKEDVAPTRKKIA